MSRPVCDICGKQMRQYGDTWKCMTSPADHKKILTVQAKIKASRSGTRKGFRKKRKK